jgi:hypothetical protein
VFGTDEPILLALGWGIIATWWVGLCLGLGLAYAARAGSRPPRSVQSLARPIGMLMLVCAASAALMGTLGFFLAEAGRVKPTRELAELLPREKHARFMADLWAHTTSYAVGFFGGLFVIVRVWKSRKEANGRG